MDKLEPNWDEVNKTIKEVENRLGKENLCGNMNGLEFSIIMQSLLVSKYGYIMDTGNWENANYVCAYELVNKIKKHPLLWKLFMLA